MNIKKSSTVPEWLCCQNCKRLRARIKAQDKWIKRYQDYELGLLKALRSLGTLYVTGDRVSYRFVKKGTAAGRWKRGQPRKSGMVIIDVSKCEREAAKSAGIKVKKIS